jgi:two-component system chemotaxis response regulator CheB
MANTTKVLIVDDSALVRQMLKDMIESDPAFEVVGVATDPLMARDKIKKLNPDVLTLDVEMPKMDGITFLRNLMRLRPMPVLMVSSLTEAGAEVTLEALELGAVDFVTKPKVDLAHSFEDYQREILSKLRMVASVSREKLELRSARLNALFESTASPGEAGFSFKNKPAADIPQVAAKHSADVILPYRQSKGHFKTTDAIIAIGASTGGTEAIKVVLESMPPDAPGIVIAQHIPEAFSGPFAERMNRSSAMTVVEARDGQQIIPGHVYIAPGSHHLLVERDGARYVCRLSDGEPVNRHRPSVDVLFRSVAQNAGKNAIGVILTGMGADGAKGLKEIQETGAKTIAQDEQSSVVWGMPGEAVKLGAADQIMPLDKIASTLIELVKKMA